MNPTRTYLVTVYYDVTRTLVECAIKLHNGFIREEISAAPMEHKAFFHSQLPLHIQTCGPVVSVREIADLLDTTRAAN